MKQLRFSSFRQRLNAAFLAVSLVPLLLCSALLLQIFRLRMTADQQQNAQQQLDGACYAVDTMHEGLASAAAALQKSRTVLRALSGGQADSAAVYSVLFDATEPVRRFARFDLYDADGTLRYSTQTAPEEQMLSTSWGVLQEAVQEEPGVIVYCASGNPLELSEPVLRAAARLTMDGQTAGYLVAAMYESHFRTLLDAMAGAQNALLVMDRFWHGIYCSQQAQVLTLSNALRGQLLAGRALTGLSDNFLYTARQSGTTGLYLVLQQPQVFTRGTLRLLYTVSALCALGGVAVSILLSLQLSRQVFQPIGALHHAITKVGKNDLQVQVPVQEGQHDELGELAQQFNRMVLSLRRNQQALLQNQQALNDAQIRMMQAQLNPHFLYNTMSTIQWRTMALTGGRNDASDMIENLSDLLHYVLDSRTEWATLREELAVTESYVAIQKIRHQNQFDYICCCPQEAMDARVMKMMLQPLVENSISHGMKEDERLNVRVNVELNGDHLCIRVSDDGEGIDEEKLKQVRKGLKSAYTENGRHIGLYNVNKRITLVYGETYGVEIESEYGKGTTITLKLPLVKDEALFKNGEA